MEIERKIVEKINIKTMVCYMVPRFYEDSDMYIGEKKIEIGKNGEGIPQEIFDNFDIETSCSIFTKYFAKEKFIKFVIDINTGVITNWPEGLEADIWWKVCDQGLYQYYDDNDHLVTEYDGYVPDELSITDEGFGDYVGMQISEKGLIHGWEYVAQRIEKTIKDVMDNADNL